MGSQLPIKQEYWQATEFIKTVAQGILAGVKMPTLIITLKGDICCANEEFYERFSLAINSSKMLNQDKKFVYRQFYKSHQHIISKILAESTGGIVADKTYEISWNENLYKVNRHVLKLDGQDNIYIQLSFVEQFSDIIEYKDFKRKRHQLEESQRIAKVGSWEYNFETDLFICSEEFKNITGFSNEETVSVKRMLASTFSKKKRKEVSKYYREIFNNSITLYKNELSIKTKSGSKIIVSDSGKIIRDEKGKPKRVYSTIQDITDYKRTNAELRKSKEKLNSLLKALPDRVFVINSEGVFTEYYDNIPTLTVHKGINYCGYKIEDVYSSELSDLFLSHLEKALRNGENSQFEYCEGEGLFERWYEVRTSLCNKAECVFLVREITQSRKSTQELLKAKRRAEESDHLKSSFLANISHEIRTPLNAMMGFSNILAEENLSEEEKKTYLGIINRNADQLTSLFSDLLDISKIESGQLKIYKEPVNINEELEKIYYQFDNYLKSAGKTNVELRMSLGTDVDDITVIADETRFVQIFTNLLTNAIKFTDNGLVEFGYRAVNKSFIRFYVKDTGKGIPADELESIFIRFRQSATNNVKKHGGTGLGLAITESLVHLMGGRIWVESEEGKGSVFYFTLPC